MKRNLLTRWLVVASLFVTFLPAICTAQPSSGLTTAGSNSPVLQYSLPPDKLAKAYALYRIDGSLYVVTGIWAVLVLWVMLRGRFGQRLSALAQRVSRRRVLQAFLAMSLFVVVLQLTQLPFEMYGHSISLKYGLSVQRWGSWFGDWGKSLLLACLFASLLGWILYGIIRRSPQRWWFYFWLAFIPIVVLAMFVEPVWIEPLFNKYEPLNTHHADLVEQIERVVQRAGMEIPPQRMYEMKASEKTTTLNAYVTGFGATKRVVVWDTTMKDMTILETLFVFGHEMGHYVLGHIPKEVSIILLILLALFYLAYRLANGLLARYGERWGIQSLSDWSSLPMLALILFILTFLATPMFSGVSRHFEHQADQYGIEVIHGLVPDEPRTAALAFQKLGEISLDYPYVSKFWELWAWDHPTIRDRMIYVQTYNPWAEGKQPEFVKNRP